jgi:hypothetical protein
MGDVHWKAMDRVRFGRALGYGARHAAKTLVQAVDAASAPSSSSTRQGQPPTVSRPARASVWAEEARQRAAEAPRAVAAARKQAKGSFIAPIARFSGTLWLQVSGVFFALVAVTMGVAAWRARAGLHAAASSPQAMKLYICVAVCAVFAYFAVSSFVRAERR